MPTIFCVPLPPLPEVKPGDDLAALIAAAWRDLAAAQPELAPRPDDVLVVTQKVVSKAEGRIVDLTTITPREEAVDFAQKWDRDARQVEVVLRESAEILRMERGLVISRTHHGFVCANAGVDASNTGRKDIVTLLPSDPDASARRIRDLLPALLDIREQRTPAVIISDSFGRPWRFGIVDVALGVAGIEPLIDLRDTPDADGRIMHSTIVAVADQICSAAELAAGKSSRQPVVLVRGVEFNNRGQSEPSVIRDVVMPTEMDLFK
jgi:coenzyme F420-0:L-glutamate ligase/coenzyme F420-1:gamma-L-glutamate ligase